MLDQTTPTPSASAERMSPQEAFVSVMIASARADGAVSPHEANQIEHVVAAMKLFRGYSDQALQGLFTTAAERIRDLGVARAVEAAAATVPKELGATTFAVAVDLMLSDGRISANEQRVLNELRVLLDVDPETAARILDVLTIKNAG